MNFGFKMAVAEMLKAFVNHTVKGSRRKHSKTLKAISNQSKCQQ